MKLIDQQCVKCGLTVMRIYAPGRYPGEEGIVILVHPENAGKWCSDVGETVVLRGKDPSQAAMELGPGN